MSGQIRSEGEGRACSYGRPYVARQRCPVAKRLLIAQLWQLFKQCPCNLLVVRRCKQRFEIHEGNGRAPKKAARVARRDAAVVRLTKQRSGFAVCRHQAQRIKPLNQHEQRPLFQLIGCHIRASVLTVPKRLRRAFNGVARLGGKRLRPQHAYRTGTSPRHKQAEQIPRFIKCDLVFVTSHGFFHTRSCSRKPFAV